MSCGLERSQLGWPLGHLALEACWALEAYWRMKAFWQAKVACLEEVVSLETEDFSEEVVCLVCWVKEAS